MARIHWIFISVIVLIGLTSCGQKEEPKVARSPSPAPVVKVKPLESPPSPPKAMSLEPSVHKVGILLPLSGPQSQLGRGMLDAAEMALFDASSSAVKLLPKDTNQGAHQAALKALDEGAELLLGPIFASEVDAVKPLLSARNVSLIAFSTDQSVAGNGSYILGFLPSQQIEHIVTYAKERGISKIAAFIPEDQYGILVNQTLKQLEAKGKIQLLGITTYTKGDILEGHPGNARLLEDLANYKAKGVEALLIPEGGENLGHIVNLLSPHVPPQILGSGQWDTPETMNFVTSLKGGLFPSTDLKERQNFEARFQSTYGYTPPRVATLAYDAVALAIALANKGYGPQTLTFPQGFSGIDGVFRLTPYGLNERALAILEVEPSGFRTLSPAPRTF